MDASADDSKEAADAYGIFPSLIMIVCYIIMACTNNYYLAFLGMTAILSDRNARLSTDPEESKKGIIQWIVSPEAPKRKRGQPVWFFA